MSINVLDGDRYVYVAGDTTRFIEAHQNLAGDLVGLVPELNTLLTSTDENKQAAIEAAGSAATDAANAVDLQLAGYVTDVTDARDLTLQYRDATLDYKDLAQQAVIDAQAVAAGNVFDDSATGALGWSSQKISDELALVTSADFEFGETIGAGVNVALGSDGKIYPISETPMTLAQSNPASPVSGADVYWLTGKIFGNTIIVTYRYGAVYIRAGVITGDSISWGTAVNIDGYTVSNLPDIAYHATDNTYIVTRRGSLANYNQEARSFTVSGNTITLSPTKLYLGINPFTHGSFLHFFPSLNKTIAMGITYMNGAFTIAEISSSGGVLTLGDKENLSSGVQGGNTQNVFAVDDDLDIVFCAGEGYEYNVGNRGIALSSFGVLENSGRFDLLSTAKIKDYVTSGGQNPYYVMTTVDKKRRRVYVCYAMNGSAQARIEIVSAEYDEKGTITKINPPTTYKVKPAGATYYAYPKVLGFNPEGGNLIYGASGTYSTNYAELSSSYSSEDGSVVNLTENLVIASGSGTKELNHSKIIYDEGSKRNLLLSQNDTARTGVFDARFINGGHSNCIDFIGVTQEGALAGETSGVSLKGTVLEGAYTASTKYFVDKNGNTTTQDTGVPLGKGLGTGKMIMTGGV